MVLNRCKDVVVRISQLLGPPAKSSAKSAREKKADRFACVVAVRREGAAERGRGEAEETSGSVWGG